MVKTKTSQLKNYSNSIKGFTLVEIMIVLAILSTIVVLGIPRIKSPQNNVKAVARHLSVLSREVRNEARVKNMTHRIVFKMEDGAYSYWVEAANGNVLAKTDESIKAEKDKSVGTDEAPSNPFSKSEKFFKGVKKLPDGFSFGFVETSSRTGANSDNEAYVYFSPEGLVEKAAILITNKKEVNWTLVINPLTGFTDVIEKETRLKDLRIE